MTYETEVNRRCKRNAKLRRKYKNLCKRSRAINRRLDKLETLLLEPMPSSKRQ